MNGTPDGLRAGILQHPDEFDRWLVYADWLDEHADAGSPGIREFARCGREKVRPIARYIHLAASAEASTDEAHSRFCRQALAEADRVFRGIIEDFVNDHSFDLIETEELASEMAMTNAAMWSVDQVEVNTIRWNAEACIVEVSYSASGEQNEDQVYSGHIIAGTATATIDIEEQVSFDTITAELEREVHDDEFEGDIDEDPYRDETR